MRANLEIQPLGFLGLSRLCCRGARCFLGTTNPWWLEPQVSAGALSHPVGGTEGPGQPARGYTSSSNLSSLMVPRTPGTNGGGPPHLCHPGLAAVS